MDLSACIYVLIYLSQIDQSNVSNLKRPRSLDPLACFSSYLILDKNRSLGKVHENSVCVFVFIPTLSLVINPPPIRNNLTIKLKTSPR